MMTAARRGYRRIAVLAALSVVVTLLVTAVLLWQLRVRDLEHARLENVALARMLADETGQAIDGIDQVLRGTIAMFASAEGRRLRLDGAQTHFLLVAHASGVRHLAGLYLVDPSGVTVNSSWADPQLAHHFAHDRLPALFKEGAADAPHISGPEREPATQAWTVHMARPLRTANGQVRGFVVATVAMESVAESWRLVRLDYDRALALLSVDGRVFAALPARTGDIGSTAAELAGESLPAEPGSVRSIDHVSGAAGALTLTVADDGDGVPASRNKGQAEGIGLLSMRERAFAIGAAFSVESAPGAARS